MDNVEDEFLDNNFELIHKRLPPKFYTSSNDFYITRKTKIIVQFNKCKKLLDQKEDTIVIHALGSAINQAMVLAVKLENAMKNSVRLDVITSSVNVTDDILTKLEKENFTSRHRVVSAIHIFVSRIIY